MAKITNLQEAQAVAQFLQGNPEHERAAELVAALQEFRQANPPAESAPVNMTDDQRRQRIKDLESEIAEMTGPVATAKGIAQQLGASGTQAVTTFGEGLHGLATGIEMLARDGVAWSVRKMQGAPDMQSLVTGQDNSLAGKLEASADRHREQYAQDRIDRITNVASGIKTIFGVDAPLTAMAENEVDASDLAQASEVLYSLAINPGQASRTIAGNAARTGVWNGLRNIATTGAERLLRGGVRGGLTALAFSGNAEGDTVEARMQNRFQQAEFGALLGAGFNTAPATLNAIRHVATRGLARALEATRKARASTGLNLTLGQGSGQNWIITLENMAQGNEKFRHLSGLGNQLVSNVRRLGARLTGAATPEATVNRFRSAHGNAVNQMRAERGQAWEKGMNEVQAMDTGSRVTVSATRKAMEDVLDEIDSTAMSDIQMSDRFVKLIGALRRIEAGQGASVNQVGDLMKRFEAMRRGTFGSIFQLRPGAQAALISETTKRELGTHQARFARLFREALLDDIGRTGSSFDEAGAKAAVGLPASASLKDVASNLGLPATAKLSDISTALQRMGVRTMAPNPAIAKLQQVRTAYRNATERISQVDNDAIAAIMDRATDAETALERMGRFSPGAMVGIRNMLQNMGPEGQVLRSELVGHILKGAVRRSLTPAAEGMAPRFDLSTFFRSLRPKGGLAGNALMTSEERKSALQAGRAINKIFRSFDLRAGRAEDVVEAAAISGGQGITAGLGSNTGFVLRNLQRALTRGATFGKFSTDSLFFTDEGVKALTRFADISQRGAGDRLVNQAADALNRYLTVMEGQDNAMEEMNNVERQQPR